MTNLKWRINPKFKFFEYDTYWHGVPHYNVRIGFLEFDWI